MSSVRFARRYFLYFLIAAGALVPAVAAAQSTQERIFYNTLLARCNTATVTDPLFLVCSNAQPGGLSAGVYTPGATTTNVGSTGSYGGAGKAAASERQRELDDLLGDEEGKKKRKKAQGASGDFTAGPFGGFITAQRSLTTRALTDLENGYKSHLDGFLVGLDRRFGNDLVTGATVGRSDTDSNYLNNAGTMSGRNTTAMLYTTYLPGPRTYMGAYLGGGKGSQDATRAIKVGLISGTASSTTNTHQKMAGLSGGYSWYPGAATVGVTAAADYVQNRTDSTTETGTTGLEFIYPEQKITSLTSSLGGRASYRSAFDWGAIVPSIRAAFIHEYRDNARTVSPRLALDPNTVFNFRTDEPDRNYYITGAGATVEAWRGTQFFVDYEKRGGHRFIETWAASVGAIVEF
jgi:uncharacterized protein YhjY with autotransporter beta-barrel domain